MWKIIEETVDRAVGGIIYDIWGAVGVSTSYDTKNKQVSLIVYDKSYKCADKKEIINKKFNFDLEAMSLEPMGEIRAKDTVVTTIEKYLIENYT
ncbi:hypothetical protein HYH96_17390 [Clostridium botulinum]|uniref:Uncharacterized protein n=1 Tax=Clostridium botulinum TaxID=1491 RepID=A0A846JGV6_CLOBO|nr:hypothetical protein [Clostridium botulinum]ACA57556.1 hypothetical protein CLK_A0012 [Clostridium botulinum A3 str. Loch Maree]MBD5631146.1 hypothetical protein [Clostridium botulinum]MBD5645647.1 hypothetical protein [Clostridium botulinum]NFH65546.1 hypothetical protein [Clostridium botulinum]NFJ09404.1 hypothetical protein [Clostridium botulinum]